ncbi:hypothetical protein CJ030_MR2G004237 [Morella rubra]|uniref:Receptor-like protein 12 n=1 Tax=Morella rubra TaxID=262757 RepID=A0A6A1WGD1_9ROSI|nr:hypothetical protein CJ030_MR2G004237 [Morella rubra]
MLQQLGFSFNSLSLKLSTSWVPPFSLRTIQLSSCKVGPAFPRWLQTQREFEWLEMSSAEILDTIPDWFWDLSHSINFLNLSHNQIQGTIPRQWFSLNFTGYPILDMSHNRFNGLLPSLHPKTTILNLSNNSFQGSITSFCETLSVSENLNYLDLSHNSLFGEIPKYCFSNMQYLQLLNLANNHFNGTIPDSVGQSGCSRTMRMLQLQNNLFTGELPERLMNCRSLAMLDLGENKLSGKIPAWIGKSLQNLVALRLSSNSFNGSIPVNLCQLSRLQILDLSDNNITGTLPRCLTNFTCMTKRESSSLFLDSFLRVVPPMSKLSYGSEGVSYGSVVGDCIRSNYRSCLDKLAVRPRQQIIRNLFLDNYIANLFVIFKGKNREFDKTLHLLKLIDLSSNKLEGEIPREITSLSGLIGLNLSRNLLSGTIPQSIDSLKDLNFLDLSRNHLSGPIPQSLATLSLLGYLNLANNNLSGKIPTGTQLQSFSASVYAGNRYLCGLPLPTKCLGDEATQGPPSSGKHEDVSVQEHANSYDQLWLYSSIALGFIVGFWGVCGSLLLKSSWRRAYFQSLENIGDRIYVTVVVSVAKLLRNFKIK